MSIGSYWRKDNLLSIGGLEWITHIRIIVNYISVDIVERDSGLICKIEQQKNIQEQEES